MNQTPLKVRLTGTFPSHIHCNGMPLPTQGIAREIFGRLVDSIPARQCNFQLAPLSIVTFSTMPRGSTPLERSAATLGVPLYVLRADGPWENFRKLQLAIDFLEATRDPVVLFSDARDALLVRPRAEILAQFEALEVPALLSAERNSYPRGEDVKRAELATRRHSTPWVHGNSGGVIGYRDPLLQLYRKALEFPRHAKVRTSDQWCLRQAALALSVPRDETAALFLTLYNISPHDVTA